MSTTYHPQMAPRFEEARASTDGQSERTIQTFEDMLRACVMELGGSWEDHLPLVEFVYNNNYQESIQMALYQAFYDRPCTSPLSGWKLGRERLSDRLQIQRRES